MCGNCISTHQKSAKGLKTASNFFCIVVLDSNLSGVRGSSPFSRNRKFWAFGFRGNYHYFGRCGNYLAVSNWVPWNQRLLCLATWFAMVTSKLAPQNQGLLLWAEKNYRATVPQSGCTLRWYHEVNPHKTQNLHANGNSFRETQVQFCLLITVSAEAIIILGFGEYILLSYYSFRGTHKIRVNSPPPPPPWLQFRTVKAWMAVPRNGRTKFKARL